MNSSRPLTFSPPFWPPFCFLPGWNSSTLGVRNRRKVKRGNYLNFKFLSENTTWAEGVNASNAPHPPSGSTRPLLHRWGTLSLRVHQKFIHSVEEWQTTGLSHLAARHSSQMDRCVARSVAAFSLGGRRKEGANKKWIETWSDAPLARMGDRHRRTLREEKMLCTVRSIRRSINKRAPSAGRSESRQGRNEDNAPSTTKNHFQSFWLTVQRVTSRWRL